MTTETSWCPNCAGVLTFYAEPSAMFGQVAFCPNCSGRFNAKDHRFCIPPDDPLFRCRFCRAVNPWDRGGNVFGGPPPRLVCWRCGQIQPTEQASISPGGPPLSQAVTWPAAPIPAVAQPPPGLIQQPAQAPQPEWDALPEEAMGSSIGRSLVATLTSLLLFLISLTAGLAFAYALLQGGYFPLKSAYESPFYWPQLFSLPLFFGLFTAAFILPGLWRRITRAPSRSGCSAYALMLLRGITVGMGILLAVILLAGRGLVSQQAFDRLLLEQEKPGFLQEAPTSLPGGESFAPEQILPAAPVLDSPPGAAPAGQAPALPTPVDSGGGRSLIPTQGALPSAPTQAPAGAASGGSAAPSPVPARPTSLPTAGVPGSQTGNLPRVATSPPAGRPTSEPSSSQPQSQAGPVAHDNYSENSGCPEGMRCITQGSFAWPTTSASYCIAPDAGINLQEHIMSGDNANMIDGYMVNAARYWLANLGFNLVQENTCTTATDIIVGWANLGDPAVLGSTSINYLVNDQQVVIQLNAAFNWNPATPGGFDGRVTMTHEIGHAIGLGHDADPASMMYPDYIPGALYSINYPVGQDSVNQYQVKYNPRPRLRETGYEKYGLSGEYLTSENGATVTKQVPIPTGTKDRLQDLRAACTVTSYRPNTDPDFSFKCIYDFATAAQGYVTFTLYATESNRSSVSVYALVWDANVFPIVGWVQFGMSSDKIWLRTDPNQANTEHQLPYQHPIWVPVDASGNIRGTYLITINNYQARGSEYFGWEVRDPWNGWLTFRTFGGEGNRYEYVGGEIFILAWSGPGALYPNHYGLNTQINVVNQSYQGNQDAVMKKTGLKIWASNASAYSSLIGYYPHQSRSYEAKSLARAESGGNQTVDFETEIHTWNGNPDSWVTFQNVLFQVWK